MNNSIVSQLSPEIKKQYDFIPHGRWTDDEKPARPAPYKLKQIYPDDHDLWGKADSERVGIRLNNLVLVDYDANKPEAVGEIPSTEELATALGYANYKTMADETLIQYNDELTSLHFLFTAPDNFNVTDFKQSNQGTKEFFWKHIDLKTHNQLVYLKEHKTANLRAVGTYPLAPQIIMDQLKRESTHVQTDFDYSHKCSEHQIKLANEWLAQTVIEMENTPDGSKNGTLNTLAVTVAGLVAGGALDNQSAHTAMFNAAIKAGCERGETIATLESAWQAGGKTPRRDCPYTASTKTISEVFAGHVVDNTNIVEAGAVPKISIAAGKGLSFDNFSFIDDLPEMRKRLTGDKYVMGKLAILGESTVFYAEQNSGKTLLTIHLLIEAIKRGEINAEKIYYINSDDNFKGLCTKGEMVKQSNFKMLANGHAGFKNEMLIPILNEMVEKDTANGAIVILDTLKKFTDLMDKKSSSSFAQVVRAFTSKGGTVIALAHTNKHRNSEGKLIYQGTNDILSDFDCGYIMDLVSGKDTAQRVVEFVNDKARGNVVDKVSYTYTKHDNSNYLDIFKSIKEVSNDEAEAQKRANRANQLVEDNADAIDAVIEAINIGHTTRTEIQKYCKNEIGVSMRQSEKVFSQHCGDIWSNGHRINFVGAGEGNKRIYNVIKHH